MLKKFSLLTIIILGIFTNIVTVSAADEISIHARNVIENFNTYLEEGDENIYSIIDENNIALKEEIDSYLGSTEILYSIKDVEKNEDGSYTVSGPIDAHGPGWNVSGFTVTFDIKEMNGDYKIISTSLFDIIGPKNVTKFVFTIFGIVFGSLAIIGIIVIIIVVVILRKRKEKYTGAN